MILKGNQRGGGQQLAAHLENSFDNERVEVADVRGAVAQDLSGAFAEWRAQSRVTKCRKYLYSLSLNPDQSQGHLTRDQYYDLLTRTERSLKLVGQPRAVVFHEKKDKDGVPREHCHAVWSRIDAEKMKAVHIAHDRLKLRTVAREFCKDHGLELPDGMKPKPSRNRDSFAKSAANKESFHERQQRERTGIDTHVRKADIATCWKETGNGEAFVHALETKGYFLARGDQRGYVVIDLHGEVHSLSRQLSGIVRNKQLVERLVSHPVEKLPGVEDAKAWAKQQREKLDQQKIEAREKSEIEKRQAALKERQQQRRAAVDKERIDLLAQHLSQRDDLKHMQQAEITGVASARLAKRPKGVLAFLRRITGIKMMAEARQRREDLRRADEHKRQMDALHLRQEHERKRIDRRYRALDRLHARENKAAEMAVKREQFQKTLALLRKPPGRALTPEFRRVAQPPVLQKTGTGDGKPVSPKQDFGKAAQLPAPPVDLTKEFNRGVEQKRSRENRDRDHDGPDFGR